MVNNIIKELNNQYPNYKFTKAGTTYQAEAIINMKCKPGVEDLAYYGGDSVGYCSLGSDFWNIKKYIKAACPDYKVIEFIDGNRKGHFELHR
jgi:hypothetical protein